MILAGVVAGEKVSGGGGGGGGAVALVAHDAANTNSSFAGTITTPGVDTTGADFLVLVIGNYNNADAAPSDSFANSWQPLGRYGNYGSAQIFYCYGPTVGLAHTFTAVSGGSDIGIAMAAFSGMKTTAAVFEAGTDVHSASIFSGVTAQAGSVTPAAIGDLVIAGLGGIRPTAPVSIDSGFTITDAAVGGFVTAALGYLITTGAGALDPTWTVATNTNRIQATIAGFAQM